MTLAWKKIAGLDLVRVRRYAAQHDPEAAARLTAEIREAAVKAAEWPMAGRVVPEWGEELIRERWVRKRYRLIYVVGDRGVTILRVFEGHQLLPAETPEI